MSALDRSTPRNRAALTPGLAPASRPPRRPTRPVREPTAEPADTLANDPTIATTPATSPATTPVAAPATGWHAEIVWSVSTAALRRAIESGPNAGIELGETVRADHTRGETPLALRLDTSEGTLRVHLTALVDGRSLDLPAPTAPQSALEAAVDAALNAAPETAPLAGPHAGPHAGTTSAPHAALSAESLDARGSLLAHPATGLISLEIPGVVSAIFDHAGQRLLYATTPALAALGLKGGRYELTAGRLTLAEAPVATA